MAGPGLSIRRTHNICGHRTLRLVPGAPEQNVRQLAYGPRHSRNSIGERQTEGRRRGRKRDLGRSSRGHRHGRRNAGSEGQVRPQSSLRRKGTLDPARHAWNDPRSAMPELAEPRAGRSPDAYLRMRWPAPELHRRDRRPCLRFPYRFVPFIGSGTGGSWALPFSTGDFTPRQNFRTPGDSTVPEAWPITYDQIRPWPSIL